MDKSRQTLDEAQVTAHVTTAFFSEEEWKLLHAWQKELYRNVMKDIHDALMSLGPLIASTVCSLTAKENKVMSPIDEPSEKRPRMCYSSSCQNTNSDLLLPINKEDEPYVKSTQDPEKRSDANNINSYTGHGILLWAEDEEEPEGKDHLGLEQVAIPSSPRQGIPIVTSVFSMNIKQEEPHCMDRSSDMVHSTETPVVTPELPLILKEEGDTCNLDQNPAESVESTDSAECAEIEPESTTEYWKWDNETCMEKGTPQPKLHDQTNSRPIPCTDNEDTTEIEEQSPWNQQDNTRNRQDPSTEFGIGNIETIHSTNQCKPHKVKTKGIWNKSGNSCLQRSDYIIHQAKCKREKRDASSECMKSFSMTIHDCEKVYTCTECGKSISKKSSFINHLRTHTGEKPYTCSVCGKSFSAQSSHNRHLRTHTGEKPYRCNKCGRRFNDRSNHMRHMRCHSQEAVDTITLDKHAHR